MHNYSLRVCIESIIADKSVTASNRSNQLLVFMYRFDYRGDGRRRWKLACFIVAMFDRLAEI